MYDETMALYDTKQMTPGKCCSLISVHILCLVNYVAKLCTQYLNYKMIDKD